VPIQGSSTGGWRRIHKLYQVESAAEHPPDADRHALLRERSAPLLEQFGTWLEEQALRVLP
jgi:hypothetical protein